MEALKNHVASVASSSHAPVSVSALGAELDHQKLVQ